MSKAASLHLWTEADGSTHYTVNAGAGGGSTHCSVYDHRTPIATFWHAGGDVTIAPADDLRVTDAELRFAQDLADMALAYLAACERFHTPDTDHGTAGESGPGRVA